MFMIMFVLDDPEFLDRILQSWTEAQIKGCTIVESTGSYRSHHKHVPMRYAYGSETPVEQGNVTIFAIVEHEDIVRACLEATERIVGNLDEPNTGVFAAWPLPIVKGVPIS
jgi:hypothetical protein